MASLYAIEQELLDIFSQIESNDGEITEELDASLKITEEELRDKLNNYYRAVLSWGHDVESISTESKRLAARKKILSNRVDRLKGIMLNAVQNFGADGKSGNKVIELSNVRLSTRSSKSMYVSDYRINLLIGYYKNMLLELHSCELINPDEADFESVIGSINAIYKAEFDGGLIDTYEPFTVSDLKSLRMEMSIKLSAWDLITKPELLEAYSKNEDRVTIFNTSGSAEYKNLTKDVNEEVDGELTTAWETYNTSIQIK